MEYKIGCQDLGMSDDFEIEANSKEQLMKKMIQHAKDFHNFTEMELNDPRMEKLMKEKMWSRED